MKSKLLMLSALMVLSLPAFATGASNNCNGNGSCGTTTNNTSNTTNQGGTGYGGSAIGTGGTSSATSSSTGGNASIGNVSAVGGSSNTDVRNTNTNINGNSVDSKNTNTNVGINGQQQGQKQSTENSNNSSNSVNVESARNPVNTAYAPSVAPTANCALSVSGGVSFVGFSGSFGKAYIDQNCVALERVRTVSQVLGDNATAESLMCLDPTYKQARLNAGRACPVEQE